MSRRIDLPTEHHVREAMAILLKDTADGTIARTTVVELARRLNLSNTTFWRNYPGIAREITALNRKQETSKGFQGLGNAGNPENTNHLARENQDLRRTIDLAAANIARLTIENHHLREALQAATTVTTLPARNPRAV